MSDLTQFRDHCRKMAKAAHKPDCNGGRPHLKHPTCRGCVTPADRLLWRRLATETDRYLTNGA